MKTRIYTRGRPISIELNQPTAVLEVELDDGRTVQLNVDKAGAIFLRGWGNIPAKVGNDSTVELICQINPQKPTHCFTCHNSFDAKDRCCGRMRE